MCVWLESLNIKQKSSLTQSLRSAALPQKPVLQGKLWRKLQNATLRKTILKLLCLLPNKQSYIVCKPTGLHLTALWLSLPLSPLLFASVSVKTISLCILNGYFSVLSPSVYKSVISKDLFLLFEALLFLVSTRASYLVFCEGASISEDPPHPYQWLPFIWCHWKCMHFLLGRMK